MPADTTGSYYYYYCCWFCSGHCATLRWRDSLNESAVQLSKNILVLVLSLSLSFKKWPIGVCPDCVWVMVVVVVVVAAVPSTATAASAFLLLKVAITDAKAAPCPVQPSVQTAF